MTRNCIDIEEPFEFYSYFWCWLESYVRNKDLMPLHAKFHSLEGLLLIICSHVSIK